MFHRDAIDRMQPVLAPGNKRRFIGSQPQDTVKILRLFRQQPLRKAAAIPFSTDVRPGTKNYIQPILFGQGEKFIQLGHVEFRIIIHRSWHGRFMPIPAGIRLHRVETRGLDPGNPIGPQLFGTSKIVERPAEDERVFPLDLKAVPVVTNALRLRKDARRQRRVIGARHPRQNKWSQHPCKMRRPKTEDAKVNLEHVR